MNVYSNMPGVPDMNSMVWMGASQPNPEMTMELMPGESTDMLLEAENPYFTPSLHSLSNISNQSIDDINTINNSQMDSMENLDMMPYMDMKHESNDSSYTEDDSPHPVYMITTATQTLPSPTRKIKPIKHPGLVLKTPIAYQSNTDPSVIPIQKDGIAVCEKCGAIGVKHAFYTRERRFCSMACARGYSGLDPPEPLSMMASGNHHQQQPSPQQQMLSSSPTATAAIATTPATTPATTATTTTLDNQNNYHFARHRFSLVGEDDFSNTYIDEELPQLPPPPPPSMMAAVHNMDESLLVRRKPPSELANSHDWDAQLMNDPYFIAAPVTCFKHAPMADIWANVMVGMKAEVENTDCDNASDAFPDSFWVATVMRIVGYKALLRYEGFGSNDTKDFWVSLCSNQVHPVGWCATRGKPLIPPKTIEDKYSDWKDFLSKRLTGARTLPSNFSNKTSDSHKSRFQCGLNLEVVDKNRISQVKVAMVHKIVGKRLNVKYFDLPPDDAGFWCHEDSPLLHPVGWAKRVGHHLVAPVNYLERVNHGLFDEDDATDKLFLPIQIGTMDPYCERGYLINRFRVGMKLEAIDPLNLSSICVATVMNVLRHGYIMIRIDTYESDMTGADWFCYHISSPCIFPVGFCEKYGITLTPPKGYDPTTFHWRTYLEETHNEAASPDLFNSYIPLHGFVQSMKIEAADLMDPRLVCVATVAKVAGRLLKVHFDGWEEEYDQWLDCESSDIYPVGWCQSVGHKLEGPPPVPRVTQPVPKLPKVGMKKRGRKKKLKDQLSPKATLVATTTQTVCTRPADVDPEYEEEQTSVSGSITYEVEEKHEDPAADVMSSTDDYNRGPEAGQEPAGPDQSLPVSSEVQPPPAERKATSYINTSPTTSAKFIPRLVDNSSGGNNTESGGELCPEDWNVFDVAQFLRVNDCANYCDSFSKQKIDGKALMQLNKEDILEYTGGKVGPSLKIYHLIQQLKMKVNPAQIRHMKANIKKFL